MQSQMTNQMGNQMGGPMGSGMQGPGIPQQMNQMPPQMGQMGPGQMGPGQMPQQMGHMQRKVMIQDVKRVSGLTRIHQFI